MRKLFTLAAAVLFATGLWASQTDLITDVTLPDIPASSLDLETQTFKTADANGWIVMEPNGDIRNASVTWFTALAWNTTSVTISDVSSYTAPFITLNSVSCTTVRMTERTKAIRFTGAEAASFLASSTNNSYNFHVALYSYDGESQTLVENKQTGNAYTELYYSGLTPSVNYIAYFYADKNSNAVIAEIALKKPVCEDPESTIKADTSLFVGDSYNLGFDSKSSSGCSIDVKKNGAFAMETVDFSKVGVNNFTFLAAGEFVITISQAADGTHCALEESVTVTVSEKTPVSAVTIDGPAEGIIGAELVYTATAAGATAYEWYLDDVKQGSDSAKFIYTAVKGNHSIVCKARNEFNATEEWIASDAKAVTVTKLCGELIKAVYDSSTKKSTVTGVVGGTADRNTQDNGKLGSNGHYYGVALTSGSFMAGDTVKVVASALNGGNTATIYADKTGTTLLGSAAFDTESLTAEVVLTQAANVVYLYRKDSGCNPNIGSLSVIRACEESDNKNAKIRVNGELVEPYGTAFNYTLSNSYTDPTVAIEIILEHPLATLQNDHALNFTMNTPDVGDTEIETFTVVAENGSTWMYVISLEKSASLDDDATLSELSVAGLTLDPVFDANVTEYTVTKAYEAAMPVVGDVTATPNSVNAKGAEVTIVGNVITIVVTAENDDTKTYTITVNNAEALKSLSQVKFANGFDAFIDNANHTVKAFYLAGEAAPEATTITAGNGTAGPLSEGKIVVTGADDSQVEYAVTLEAVTPNTDVVEETAAAGAFDGTESWVKGGLHISNPTAGFSDGKYVLRRQLKSGDAADDQRVIAGWVRVYFFVGNASKFELANTTKNNKVKYAIDGGAYTEVEGALSIALEEGNHMIEIVTNQSSGDCNLSAPKLVKRTATAIDDVEAGEKAVKVIRDGQLLIIKGEKTYNIIGVQLR